MAVLTNHLRISLLELHCLVYGFQQEPSKGAPKLAASQIWKYFSGKLIIFSIYFWMAGNSYGQVWRN